MIKNVLVTECEKFFKKTLFLVGEIGGNDYNYAYFVGGNIKQVKGSVPLVVEAITKAVSVSFTNTVILLITAYFTNIRVIFLNCEIKYLIVTRLSITFSS